MSLAIGTAVPTNQTRIPVISSGQVLILSTVFIARKRLESSAGRCEAHLGCSFLILNPQGKIDMPRKLCLLDLQLVVGSRTAILPPKRIYRWLLAGSNLLSPA
jgi:hypothetical protein